MFSSDFVVIHINNNGCGYIKTADAEFECSAHQAECVLEACIREGMERKFFKRFENNDIQYIYN